ncbi:helix-turn-helix transcriptional regulator [Virgibacillus sp. CBA3643]|uniref:helix-turn-helix transcriptional regulator n=1 Tax=Virgibacillus sp. CBA3643 TaxID=2942278 RepID=UPI0035A28314
MKLKSRIGIVIEEKGYKKKWVAQQIGVSQNVLSRWINDVSMPSIVSCFKLAELLECKVDDLFTITKRNI